MNLSLLASMENLDVSVNAGVLELTVNPVRAVKPVKDGILEIRDVNVKTFIELILHTLDNLL